MTKRRRPCPSPTLALTALLARLVSAAPSLVGGPEAAVEADATRARGVRHQVGHAAPSSVASPLGSQSAGCRRTSAPGPAGGGFTFHEIRHDKLLRQYALALPADYADASPRSVLLYLHGEQLEQREALQELATLAGSLEESPIVIALQAIPTHLKLEPQQVGQVVPRGVYGWNAMGSSIGEGPEGPICKDTAEEYACHKTCGECHRCTWTSCADDVGFVASVLDAVEATHCVDLGRVFAYGFSSGGSMVFELASDPRMAHRLAAVTPSNGLPHPGFLRLPPAGQAAPRLLGIWTGTNSTFQDAIVPPLGNELGDARTEGRRGLYFATMAEVTNFWAQHDSCTLHSTAAGVELAAAAAALVESNNDKLTCLGLCGGRVIQCLHSGDEHAEEGKMRLEPVWDFFLRGLGAASST